MEAVRGKYSHLNNPIESIAPVMGGRGGFSRRHTNNIHNQEPVHRGRCMNSAGRQSLVPCPLHAATPQLGRWPYDQGWTAAGCALSGNHTL